MARIRTIKPNFFRNEELQDLEKLYPGKYPMMVFSGLWGHCDKNGNFEWKPRTLKLDILPFLDFDMEETLTILERACFIVRYVIDNKQYCSIPTFSKHQRINGKEAQEPAIFPCASQGSTGEALGKQSRRQEEEGNRNGIGREEAFQKNRINVPSFLPKNPKEVEIDRAAKKAFWEQKISEELYRRLPTDQACKVATSYMLGEQWAKDEFEKVDKILKLRKGTVSK